MRYIFATLLMVLASFAQAHELTPTYPEAKLSSYDNVYEVTMSLFNRREDISYYEILVYDADWKQVSFAASDKIMKTEYLETKTFNIYFRESDVNRVVYICTVSKILKGNDSSVISSRICSKLMR